jgi:phosphoglycerate dehydrogenase-like enzyme
MAFGVAEWSLFATLCAARNHGCSTAWHGLSKMDFAPEQAFNMRDLRNMTVGVWGMGDTTKHFLKMLQPLNPGRILVVSEHSSAEAIAEYGAEKADFETMLRESNMIHALVGLIKSNYEKFGHAEFAAMKPGATFINGGRAPLANEEALITALKSKHISAILDVYHVEPLPDNSPLYGLNNLIMTPHNAGFVGRERFIPFLLEEFDKFFAGQAIDTEISQARLKTMTDENLLSKIEK